MRWQDEDQQGWRPQERERLWARLPQPRFIASHSYDFGTTTTTLVIVRGAGRCMVWWLAYCWLDHEAGSCMPACRN